MTSEPSAAPDPTNPGGHRPFNLRAVVAIAVMVGLSSIGIVLVGPYVTHWMEVRDAFRKLKTFERQDAIRWLVQNGENPDQALLEMLEADERDREFAADQLCRRPATPQITEAVLRVLEDGQLVQEIERDQSQADYCRCLIAVLGRHSEESHGPPTETDERIIALLRPALTDSNIMNSAAAQVLADYLPHRQELGQALKPYLNRDYLYGSMRVARGFYRSDPGQLAMYLELLTAGAASGGYTRERALEYLRALGPASHGVQGRLVALRDERPDLVPAIDVALEAIQMAPPAAE